MSEESRPQSGVGGSVDLKAEMRKLPLAEKILAPIALVVVVGYFLFGRVFWQGMFFRDVGSTLAFLGALAVATIVILKLFGVRPLQAKMEHFVLAIASLLPAVGLVLTSLRLGLPTFLTWTGAIALAYVSAMTYWRRQIPGFVTKTLDAAAESTGSTPPPAAPTPPPSA